MNQASQNVHDVATLLAQAGTPTRAVTTVSEGRILTVKHGGKTAVLHLADLLALATMGAILDEAFPGIAAREIGRAEALTHEIGRAHGR